MTSTCDDMLNKLLSIISFKSFYNPFIHELYDCRCVSWKNVRLMLFRLTPVGYTGALSRNNSIGRFCFCIIESSCCNQSINTKLIIQVILLLYQVTGRCFISRFLTHRGLATFRKKREIITYIRSRIIK